MYLWTNKFTLNFETRPHLDRDLGIFEGFNIEEWDFFLQCSTCLSCGKREHKNHGNRHRVILVLNYRHLYT